MYIASLFHQGLILWGSVFTRCSDCLGQYGHSYSYLSNQQNVSLPGQLQPTSQIQPNLPGQSAQLHVTHHTPSGGVQTVHQTQVPSFSQSATGGSQQVQNVAREYVVQGPSGLPSQQLHQGLHQNSQNQVIFDFLLCHLNHFSITNVTLIPNHSIHLGRTEVAGELCLRLLFELATREICSDERYSS